VVYGSIGISNVVAAGADCCWKFIGSCGKLNSGGGGGGRVGNYSI